MLKVVLRQKAEADLVRIIEYTKVRWGEVQAKRYLEDLRARIEFAAEFPGTGSEATGLPSQYRKIKLASHRAIYRCTNSDLIVVRVVHEREDVPDDIEDLW